ncbi:MAG: 2-C-methyl-D-erythritol 4-phosphate cytidylyltransferase [Gammaproteobacteria bacterium]|nr:MAG: 2-C-methyl-D-erythritol 4-phosphate cytidylyltransferase [Gammaproteobacteria bacterium]UCH39523.1 MAG: 2-C-methyl-D-erythritol 4-phosphate cytidylyltransferase [Gammaproteobacteria bacterium]
MASDIPVWAVIPAAGSGSRMQQDKPKQYLSFQGKTILEHCLDRLLSHPAIDGAVLALQADDRFWQELDYQADKPVFITDGGAHRQHSVYSGLTTLQYRCGNDAIALVHDAVRPLVSHDDLSRVIAAAREHTAGAILAAPVSDTLKKQSDDMEIAATVPRQGLWRALTPQVFHLPVLLNALKQVIDAEQAITDDAQAVELAGYSPALVAGSEENFKITRPGDLALAEKIWLDQRNQQNNE